MPFSNSSRTHSFHLDTFKWLLFLTQLLVTKETDMTASSKSFETVPVVDDEEIIRSTIRIHLEREGHRAVTSENGEDAIDALKRYDISVVITESKGKMKIRRARE